MDAGDFELVATAIILLQESKRTFKNPHESNEFVLYLKRGKRKVHISNLNKMQLNDLEFYFKKVFISFLKL